MTSLIIASTRQNAEKYAIRKNLKDWRYVYDIHCIRGTKPFNNSLVVLDCWEQSNAACNIIGRLRMDPYWRETVDEQLSYRD